jgi:uncharacterized protein
MKKYHLRKQDKEITDSGELRKILKHGKFITISMCRNNEPYIVTLNYGYDEPGNRLYCHCALEGLKLNFLESNSHVCATAIQDLGYVDGDCNHKYRSVVFWGIMCRVEDPEEKKHGLTVMFDHLESNPEHFKTKTFDDATRLQQVTILRLEINDITGKESS